MALAFGLSQVALILGLMNAAFLQARHDVRIVSISAIVTKALWFLILLAVLGAGFQLLALPVALLLSETVRTVWLGHAVREGYGTFPSAPIGEARRVVRKSLPFYMNDLNVQFMGYSVRILVGLIGGTIAIGLLTTALLASTVPMLMTPILGWVAIPVFSSVRARGGPSELWQRVGQMLDLLAVTVCAGGVALFALSDWLMPLLFGDDFAPSGPAFALLALSVPATYVTQIVGSAFIADDRSWQNTRVNIATMIFVLVGVVVALVITGSDDPGRTAWLAAIVIAVGEWVTVATLALLRPFRWLSAQTAVRLFLVACALGISSVEKLGDEPNDLMIAAVVLVVVVAATDLPRLVSQGREVLRSGDGAEGDGPDQVHGADGDGDGPDQAHGDPDDEITDPIERSDLFAWFDDLDVTHSSDERLGRDSDQEGETT